jgi:hypothetical protein
MLVLMVLQKREQQNDNDNDNNTNNNDYKTNKENNSLPQPIRGNDGFVDGGPRNILLDKQNPNIFVPPITDHGTIPNLICIFNGSQ